MASEPDKALSNAEEKQHHLAAYQIKPGEVRNPKGRPKGSRNKYGEQLLDDMVAAWTKAVEDDPQSRTAGQELIERVMKTDPSTFLRVAVSILPKELNVKHDVSDELSDDELASVIASLRARREGAGTVRADREDKTLN